MVGGCAGFYPDQARWLLREECQQLAPRQSTLNDNRASTINTVYLKTDFPRSKPIVTAASMALLHFPTPTGGRLVGSFATRSYEALTLYSDAPSIRSFLVMA